MEHCLNTDLRYKLRSTKNLNSTVPIRVKISMDNISNSSDVASKGVFKYF